MLAPKPDVVLMDEPFSGLDTRQRDELRAATLKRLRDAGAAVVIVTHDPDEAMRLGDRIALMRDGRIVQEGTPVEIYRAPHDPQAAALFGGANVFHARVSGGVAASPFGTAPAGSSRRRQLGRGDLPALDDRRLRHGRAGPGAVGPAA